MRQLFAACRWLMVVVLLSVGALASSLDVVAGFETGYAHSAAVFCKFRYGPNFRVIDYRRLDPDANFRGTRNFFVAVRIYGQSDACADAISNYGPGGVIRAGYLE